MPKDSNFLSYCQNLAGLLQSAQLLFSYMKADTHPAYHSDATVTCACGNSFQVGSTQPAIRIELCSKCHPFYTGQQKFVDTARRVEKFQEKLTKKATVATRSKAAKEKERKEKRAEKTAKGA